VFPAFEFASCLGGFALISGSCAVPGVA